MTHVEEAFFGSRHLKVAEMDGRAGAEKISVSPQGNAAPERQTTKTFQKSVAQKTQFVPPENQKKAFPNWFSNSAQTLWISVEVDAELPALAPSTLVCHMIRVHTSHMTRFIAH